MLGHKIPLILKNSPANEIFPDTGLKNTFVQKVLVQNDSDS